MYNQIVKNNFFLINKKARCNQSSQPSAENGAANWRTKRIWVEACIS